MATGKQGAGLWRVAERVMANERLLRLCAAVYDFNWRMAEKLARRKGQWDRPGRYPNGLAAFPISVHRITPDCDIVTGNVGPVGLAVDRQLARTRAARSATRRPFLVAAVAGALLALVAVAIVLPAFGSDIAAAVKSREPRRLLLASIFFVVLPLVFFSYLTALNFGRPAFLARAVQSWGDVLKGTWGFDDVAPAVEWLRARWHWPLPPDFLEAETLWAVGTRGGRPILLVVERQDWRTILAAGEMLAASAASGRRQKLQVPANVLSRLSIFVADCVLRDDPAGAAKVHELNTWGYGVVPTAAGVYVYSGAYDRGLLPEFLLPVLDEVIAVTLPRGSSPTPIAREAG